MKISPTARLATTAGLSLAAFAARRASIRDMGAEGAMAGAAAGAGRRPPRPLAARRRSARPR